MEISCPTERELRTETALCRPICINTTCIHLSTMWCRGNRDSRAQAQSCRPVSSGLVSLFSSFFLLCIFFSPTESSSYWCTGHFLSWFLLDVICMWPVCTDDPPRFGWVSLGSPRSWWKNDLIVVFYCTLRAGECVCLCDCVPRQCHCPLLPFIFKWNGYYLNPKFKKMKLDGGKEGWCGGFLLWIKGPWNYSVTRRSPDSASAAIVPELVYLRHYFLTLPWSMTSRHTRREPHFDLFAVHLLMLLRSLTRRSPAVIHVLSSRSGKRGKDSTSANIKTSVCERNM